MINNKLHLKAREELGLLPLDKNKRKLPIQKYKYEKKLDENNNFL